MLLKMLLEPIWESDFLECSKGFRPRRRTWDCIALCYDRIHKQNKFYWVIEGDIKGCFDHTNHGILHRWSLLRADSNLRSVLLGNDLQGTLGLWLGQPS